MFRVESMLGLLYLRVNFCFAVCVCVVVVTLNADDLFLVLIGSVG